MKSKICELKVGFWFVCDGVVIAKIKFKQVKIIGPIKSINKVNKFSISNNPVKRWTNRHELLKTAKIEQNINAGFRRSNFEIMKLTKEKNIKKIVNRKIIIKFKLTSKDTYHRTDLKEVNHKPNLAKSFY